MIDRSFKSRIRDGDRLIGTWIQAGSPEIVEVVGISGFDFAIIDTEHACFGIEKAEDLVRAANVVGLIPLIRVSHKNPALVMKALDTGAEGFVYPGVTCRKDAEEAVRASRYPPEGIRGACPFVRAADHGSGNWKEIAARANRDTVRVILVEGQEGIDNFEDILSVEGIDVIMMGPFDLSVSLGVGGELEHPLVMDAFSRMIEMCSRRGVVMMPNIFDPDLVKVKDLSEHWFNSGCQSLVVNTDKLMLSWALRKNLEIARDASGDKVTGKRSIK